MASAKVEKEVLLVCKDGKGVLGKVTRTLAAGKVNIKGLCCWGKAGKARFMIITNNSAKAVRLLKKARYNVKLQNVIVAKLPNRSGAMAKVGEALGKAGVYLDGCYGSVGVEKEAACIFTTKSLKKALTVIKKVK